MKDPCGVRAPRPFRLPAPLELALVGNAAGLAGLAVLPQARPGIAAALVATHSAIVLAGLLPRCSLLGPNLVRLPWSAAHKGVVALTFDDGPDPELTPAVLAILERAGVRATFFVVGARAERYPDVVRAIAGRGHGVENHSFAHPNHFFFLGPRRLREEVGRTQRLVTSLTGCPPRFFRAPAGIRGPLLERVLAAEGLRLVSWTRRGYDTTSGDPSRIRARLTRGLEAGDVLVVHDGGSARGPQRRPVVLDVLPRLLDDLRSRGLTSVPLGEAVPGP